MSAIIYCRFSDRPNSRDCDSCERQEQHCREHAEKQGWPVKEAHQDKGLSGKDEERPGLWAAVRATRKGDVLLVYSLDRLARSVFLSELIRKTVREQGGSIAAVNAPDMDDDDPAQRLMRQILESFAEYERNVIGLRTRLAMRYKQAHGQRMSLHAPFGYKIDPNDNSRLAMDEAEQATIAKIMELSGAGRGSCEICRELERLGLRARKGKWHTQKIGNILARQAR